MQSVGIDVKAIARQRSAGRLKHPILPSPALALIAHWFDLGAGRAPRWSDFHMMDVAEAVPYMTVLRCHLEPRYTFDFMGSAVAAMLGEDLTGRTVSRAEAVWSEMDWFRRSRPVAEAADIQVLTGRANPPYTMAMDYVAADLPFMDEAHGMVSHVVGVTVAKFN